MRQSRETGRQDHAIDTAAFTTELVSCYRSPRFRGWPGAAATGIYRLPKSGDFPGDQEKLHASHPNPIHEPDDTRIGDMHDPRFHVA